MKVLNTVDRALLERSTRLAESNVFATFRLDNDTFALVQRHQGVEPHRFLDAEGAHPDALQFAQVPAAAQLLAQVVRQRAQIGSLRAAHEDAHVERLAGGRFALGM